MRMQAMKPLLRNAALAASLVGLAACQTLPAVVAEQGGRFSIRYDAKATTVAQADARAAQQCGAPAQYLSQETRFDGFQYRTYRCGSAK
jgi:hypothetical protein